MLDCYILKCFFKLFNLVLGTMLLPNVQNTMCFLGGLQKRALYGVHTFLPNLPFLPMPLLTKRSFVRNTFQPRGLQVWGTQNP